MSFILDALRKSEHERQRGATPGLAHVPLATPPPEMPRWAVLVIALLAVTVLVLAVAWWQSLRTPTPVAVVAPPFVERPLEVPRPTAAVSTPPAPATPAPEPSAREPANEPARPLSEAALGARSRPLAAAAEPEPTPPPVPAPGEEPALPSAAALMAQGIALPGLRLELHGYAPDPANRFVFINGRKYAEGERLADGPRLVAIEPQGVVLEANGRRFLLLPE